jgi:hypothetical protein
MAGSVASTSETRPMSDGRMMPPEQREGGNHQRQQQPQPQAQPQQPTQQPQQSPINTTATCSRAVLLKVARQLHQVPNLQQLDPLLSSANATQNQLKSMCHLQFLRFILLGVEA